MNNVTRVVIVDDHPMVIDGLTYALDVPGIAVVGAASNVAEALVLADSEPDVMIVDVHLPDGSGIQVCAQVKSRHPATAVLMLTMAAEDHLVTAALAAGASGYLLKGAARDEIVRAVRAVADGQVILAAEAAQAAFRGQQAPPRFPSLTEREREVLNLLADGLGNPAIAHRLGVSAKTVANHVSTILAKLQVADRTQAAFLARSKHKA